MKKSFKYEYEMTPERKFYNRLENVVNYALLFTFCALPVSGIVIAIVNLA